jgi:HTH-type transcriptional regulator, sugar sensing transcriptional regulator
MFSGLRSRARGRHPFLDLALGVDGHIRRHLVPLAAARKRILSYLETGDLMSIDTAINDGFPILRHRSSRKADSRRCSFGIANLRTVSPKGFTSSGGRR